MSDMQPDPAAELDDPPVDLAALAAERDDFRDRWMRGEAEMQNVRNRARREADDARQFAIQKFAADVSETAENLRRGLAALPPRRDGENDVVARLREGFAGVERSFLADAGAEWRQVHRPHWRPLRPRSAPGHGRAGE